jgi:predicted metal-dependent hydrolase
MPPRKRRPEELAQVSEPRLTPQQFDVWCDAIELFDDGQYWLAHERWEEIWKVMGDDSADDAEIVLRGFIQLAAGLHLLGIGRLDGARSNLEKAAQKLALAPSMFIGVDVESVRAKIPLQLGSLAAMTRFRLRRNDADD